MPTPTSTTRNNSIISLTHGEDPLHDLARANTYSDSELEGADEFQFDEFFGGPATTTDLQPAIPPGTGVVPSVIPPLNVSPGGKHCRFILHAGLFMQDIEEED